MIPKVNRHMAGQKGEKDETDQGPAPSQLAFDMAHTTGWDGEKIGDIERNNEKCQLPFKEVAEAKGFETRDWP